MTKAEENIVRFCVRQKVRYTWQYMTQNARRAVIPSQDHMHHTALIRAAQRLKGVTVKDWFCSAGGVWEGRVYLYDAEQAAQAEQARNAETERNQNWWMTYHNAIISGASREKAIEAAETAFPTPW